MEADRILIGALIFIMIVVGSNYVMYFIARSWARGSDSRWMSSLKESLSKPLDSKSNESMDELRQRVQELENKRPEK